DEAPGPSAEVPRGPPDDGRTALPGADHVRRDDLHSHRRGSSEAEVNDRRVAKTVPVRAHGRQQTAVPGEGNRTIRDPEISEVRGRSGESRGCQEDSLHSATQALTVSLRSTDAGHNCRGDTDLR